jgi:hypothetical protein
MLHIIVYLFELIIHQGHMLNKVHDEAVWQLLGRLLPCTNEMDGAMTSFLCAIVILQLHTADLPPSRAIKLWSFLCK